MLTSVSHSSSLLFSIKWLDDINHNPYLPNFTQFHYRNDLLGDEEDGERSFREEVEVEKEIEIEEENQHQQHRVRNLRSTVPEPIVATTGTLCYAVLILLEWI